MRYVMIVTAVVLLLPGCSFDVFGELEYIGAAVNSESAGYPSVSPDGLELYFYSERDQSTLSGDIFVSTRGNVDQPWTSPVMMDWDVNHALAIDFAPIVSPNGLELFFASGRPGGYGGLDIWSCKRDTVDDVWRPAELLDQPINSPSNEIGGSTSLSGLEFYFSDYVSPPHREGGQGAADLWVSHRARTTDPWGTPENLENLNSASAEWCPQLAWQDRLLLFTSNRLGGYGSDDVWVSIRDEPKAEWSEPINLGPRINTISSEKQPTLSPDGSWLYFHTWRPGGGEGADIMRIEVLSMKRFIRTLRNGTEPR